MPCKKLLNDAETCVDEMLQGVVAAYPSLTLISDQRIIVHSKNVEGRVALVTGGGSGHEPFAAGYVGEGMVTAAVAGSIFASPPSSNILHALKVVSDLNQNSGILIVVPNYTGDRLNFGFAAEEASSVNIKVKSIQIGEDCALLRNGLDGFGSGRGLCGHLFIFKIAGALALEGASLENIYSTCEDICKSMATFGVCLKPCSLPGQEVLFQLADDEIELGLGIHGEAGVSKLKITTAAEVVKLILEKLFNCLALSRGSNVCVLINNLGGTTQLEMGIVASNVKSQLDERGITVLRLYAGPLMTSLEMSGIQICLLKMNSRQEWLRYLDMKTDAPAWPGSPSSIPSSTQAQSSLNMRWKENETFVGNGLPKLEADSVGMFAQCLKSAANALVNHSVKLNDLDSACGDGDCGTTLQRFALEILHGLENNSFFVESPVKCFHQLAKIASEKMGGTSGAVYGLFLKGFASSLKGLSSSHWASAWNAGIECIMKYSSARLGDRTLLDALIPACKVFDESLKDNVSIQAALERVAEEAEEACNKTSRMAARVGRASYVNAAYVSNVDAGAFAVVVMLQAIRDTFAQL